MFKKVMRKIKLNKIVVGIQIIAYADDPTVVANTRDNLIKAIKKQDNKTIKVRSIKNEGKTKYIRIYEIKGERHQMNITKKK